MDCQYTSLDNEALLHIEGPDSLTFLQGQTTCDTRLVNNGQAVQGAYCTPKGRVVCDFLLCEIADHHYVLRMRQNIIETAAATFGKYIVFSKAEVDSGNSQWQIFGCWGSDAKIVLGKLFGAVPDEPLGSAIGEGFAVVQIDRAGCQFECYINTLSHPELAAQLSSTLAIAEPSTWLALQIDQGIGRIEAATVEEFIPQMLNYDLTGHISFNKGCYTGQEVVARLHYRGKSKRRLYLAQLETDPPAPAGAPLYSAESRQSVGTVVNSVLSPAGRSLLVVATVSGVESGLHLGEPEGPLLACQSLYDEESSDVAS